MKPCYLCLILFAACSASLRAGDVPPPESHPRETAKNEAPTPASLLAEQVRQIAATPDMSDKTKAKLIAKAVEVAVSNALAGVKDPADALRLARDLAAAAAKAAPRFAETITRAVMSNPTIADVDGALAQVQSAVHAAVQARNSPSRSDSDHANPHADFGGNNGDHIVSPSH